MSTPLQLVNDNPNEADLIDRIAELLPEEQRPLWYREMAHLRLLPADDEMLRIAHAMGFLALVTRETPHAIASEREQLTTILEGSVAAIQEARKDVISLHKQLESRLTQLPAEISEGIRPSVIAGKLNESLRQEFLKSGIPETAQTLTAVSRQMRQVATEFEQAARELAASQQAITKDARQALDQVHSAIRRAAETAKDCARDLTQTFRREYKWSVLVLCVSALLVGISLGILYEHWTYPPAPVSTANSATISKPESLSPNTPTTHQSTNSKHKPEPFPSPKSKP
jgi:gas vesicle protein